MFPVTVAVCPAVPAHDTHDVAVLPAYTFAVSDPPLTILKPPPAVALPVVSLRTSATVTFSVSIVTVLPLATTTSPVVGTTPPVQVLVALQLPVFAARIVAITSAPQTQRDRS